MSIDVENRYSMLTAIERYLHNYCDVPATERLHALVNRDLNPASSHDHAAGLPVDADADQYHQLFTHLDVEKASSPQTQQAPPAKRPRLGPSPQGKRATPLGTTAPASNDTPPPSLISRDPSIDSSSPCTDLVDPFRTRRGRLQPRILPSSSGAGNASAHHHHSVSSSLVLPTGDALPSTVPSEHSALPALPHQQACAQRAAMPCAFWFLDCKFADSDLDTWLAHCHFHIRTRPVPADGLVCPTCKATCQGWNRWLKHLADHHQQQGWDLRLQPVDDALVDHLWRVDLIDNNQRLELMSNGRIGAHHAPFLNMHNAKAERALLRGREVVG